MNTIKTNKINKKSWREIENFVISKFLSNLGREELQNMIKQQHD
jgi:hypothetical protein